MLRVRLHRWVSGGGRGEGWEFGECGKSKCESVVISLYRDCICICIYIYTYGIRNVQKFFLFTGKDFY